MTNYLTEAQMNIYFGWAQCSYMHGVYVHLSGRDVNDAILKVNGVIDKDSAAIYIQKEIENPKPNLFSIIESKVSKLVKQN